MIIGFIANDIKGTLDDESPQRVKRLFKYFVKQVRERYPDVPFLWVEITPTKALGSMGGNCIAQQKD